MIVSGKSGLLFTSTPMRSAATHLDHENIKRSAIVLSIPNIKSFLNTYFCSSVHDLLEKDLRRQKYINVMPEANRMNARRLHSSKSVKRSLTQMNYTVSASGGTKGKSGTQTRQQFTDLKLSPSKVCRQIRHDEYRHVETVCRILNERFMCDHE